MRRVVKILLWTSAFLACAGVGAYIAANTDPFPPGVEDPGLRPSDQDTGATGAPSPEGDAFVIQIRARTFHDLFVGGRCATNWRVEVSITITDGEIAGRGTASLEGDARCDTPNAQVQAERIDVLARGRRADDELVFKLVTTGISPAGAQDLGGFADALPTLRFKLPARSGAAADFEVEIPDGNRGTFGAVGRVTVGSGN